MRIFRRPRTTKCEISWNGQPDSPIQTDMITLFELIRRGRRAVDRFAAGLPFVAIIDRVGAANSSCSATRRTARTSSIASGRRLPNVSSAEKGFSATPSRPPGRMPIRVNRFVRGGGKRCGRGGDARAGCRRFPKRNHQNVPVPELAKDPDPAHASPSRLSGLVSAFPRTAAGGHVACARQARRTVRRGKVALLSR